MIVCFEDIIGNSYSDNGLQLALNLGYGHVIVQSDNSDAVTLLSPPLISTPHSLMRSISMPLSDTFDVQFKLIYRESNMTVNRMAKLDALSDGSLQSYTVPPPELSDVLN
ncbi:hypothetical protein V6N13_098414 [Hibiscus sabdariffa]